MTLIKKIRNLFLKKPRHFCELDLGENEAKVIKGIDGKVESITTIPITGQDKKATWSIDGEIFN